MENTFNATDLVFNAQLHEKIKDLGGAIFIRNLQYLVERNHEGVMLVAKYMADFFTKQGLTHESIAVLSRQISRMVEDKAYFDLYMLLIKGWETPLPEPVPEIRYEYQGFDNISPDDYEQAFQAAGLGPKWPYFKQFLKPEIRISLTLAEEDEIPIGCSKIGGRPDLPVSATWPCTLKDEPLAFLAQINLSDTVFDGYDFGLPQSGMLYFFYDAHEAPWGHLKEDGDKFKCIFIENDLDLARKDFPYYPVLSTYPACALTFSIAYGLPHLECDYISEQLLREEHNPYLDASVSNVARPTKLMGHPNCEQGPVMERDCAMATNGYVWADLATPAIKLTVDEQAKEWMLLFQLYSERVADMCWGDVGFLYFWIRKADFAQRRFDRCWMVLQCG
jgi:uncharacterized protein YwqG